MVKSAINAIVSVSGASPSLGLASGGKGVPVFLMLAFLMVLLNPLAQHGAFAQVEEERADIINPHDFSNKDYCGVCHTGSPPELSFDPVTTCTKCHMGNVGNHPVARHPIGKAPRINIAGFLPLSGKGLLVCYTCHDQHNVSGHPGMLRVEYLRLCASCHVGY